jgi:transcription elongation factor Elf1
MKVILRDWTDNEKQKLFADCYEKQPSLCPVCGHQVTMMTQQDCGKVIIMVHCRECGNRARLDWWI